MDSTIPSNSGPSITGAKVSVIIPARNEEANLERCLRSLVVQKGIPFEIFIVNDDSTDRTRTIAESFTRVRQCPFIATNEFLLDVHVLDAPQPLPTAWTGKVNALVAGEKAAGEAAAAQNVPATRHWLLFTDADTEHLEGSLAAAVAEAEEHHADLLSYSPQQILTGIRQQLLMPVIFGELAIKYSPRRISDPAMPDAAANGQYLLVRAEAHRKIGGFASVAKDLLEDVALARRYKQQERTIRFRFGGGMVRTRMYSSWEDLRLGWIKNLALLFPDSLLLAKKRTGEFIRLVLSLIIAPLWTLLYFSHAGPHGYSFWPLIIGLYWFFTLIGFVGFYFRVSRAHFPFVPTLLTIFGLPLFSSLLRQSAEAYRKGTVTWRGRTYSTTAEAEAPPIASNSK